MVRRCYAWRQLHWFAKAKSKLTVGTSYSEKSSEDVCECSVAGETPEPACCYAPRQLHWFAKAKSKLTAGTSYAEKSSDDVSECSAVGGTP